MIDVEKEALDYINLIGNKSVTKNDLSTLRHVVLLEEIFKLKPSTTLSTKIAEFHARLKALEPIDAAIKPGR